MNLVTFEIAKKLKEKGFMEKVVYYYDEKGKVNVYKSYAIGNIEHSWLDFRINKNMCKSSPWCDAPTISQVLKWLREEKLILIGLSPMQEYDCNEIIEWCCTIFKANKQGGLSWQEEFYYQSYEQAALAGIEYVLDNII